MRDKYLAAVVQAAAVPFDAERSAAKAVDYIHAAASKGAKLIVFPEVFISGYPKLAAFGGSVGRRTPEGREAFRVYSAGAIEVPGPITDRIGEAVAAAGRAVVIGVLEIDPLNGTVDCTVLFFDDKGKLLGKHRKLMPTATERLIWGFGDGSTIPVFDLPQGRIGSVICWENYMPLFRMAMYSKGITVYCAPTADDRDTWLPSMQHIALEGRCYVLSACQYITRAEYPQDYEAPVDQGVMMRGGSCIVDPLGKVLAGPNFAEETILYAEIDHDDIVRSRLDFDATGHYSRPEIFRLLVNENPMPPVAPMND